VARRPWMHCLVAVELVGQISNWTCKTRDVGAAAGIDPVAKPS
jgi:hypothetical protein